MSSDRRRQLAIGALIVILTVAAGLKDPAFFDLANIRDIAVSSSYVIIVALGMLGIIATGEIDVSPGAVLAISGALAGHLAKEGHSPVVFVGAAIAAGAVLGLLNGVLVVKARIPAIIATLGTFSLFRGGYILVTRGKWVTNLPQSILDFGRGTTLGVPTSLFIALFVFAIMAVVFKYLRYGRNVLCVGSNPDAAHLAGIRVDGMKISVFVLSGALVGLAAVIFAGLYGSIQSNTGRGLEMTAIAAVVVGGAATTGGSGTALGTLLGAILIGMIATVLIFFQISAYWEQTVHGLLILLAVGYYSMVSGKKAGMAAAR